MCTALHLLMALTLGFQRPTVDEIAHRHVEALGGMDKIESIHSYIRHGWYQEGSFRTDHAEVIKMRPFLRVIGDEKDPLAGIHEGYDGGAWEYYPDPGIVVRTVGPAAAAGRHGAMFDDPLVNPKAEGTRLTLEGMKTFAGKETYVVKCTLVDGFHQDIYVDGSTYMIDAMDELVPMHAFGTRYHTRNVFDDYKPEGGVLYAHDVKEIDTETGKVLTESGVFSMDINPDLPWSIFSPPDWKRTQVQEMIQRIYDERDEPASVMSTYYQFRGIIDVAASPTADAVDFVGYQCLKMGHSDTAIALLTANVADNPRSARAHFGLGRALEAGGRKDAARKEYLKALEIDPNYAKAKAALKSLG